MAKKRSTMVFVEMRPEDVQKAVEGQPNILKAAIEENESFFKKLSCIRCGGDVSPFIDAKRLFRSGDLLPNYLARCKACGCEFEPYTRIEITRPSTE